MKRFLLALVVALVPLTATAQVYPVVSDAPLWGLPWAQGGSSNPFTNVVFTGQALGPDNCTTAPPYSFSSAPTNGYGGSATTLCRVIGGTALSTMTATGETWTVPVLFADGAVGAPGLAPASDPDTGFYWTSSGALLMAINGTLTHQWGNTYYANSSNTATLQFGAAGDATIARAAGPVWDHAISGTTKLSVSASAVTSTVPLTVNLDGAEVNLNHTTTGSYSAIQFKEATVATNYIQSFGSTYTTAARRNNLEFSSINGLVDVLKSGLGSTPTSGARLTNLTLATGGATVQASPGLEFYGAAWKSDATAESQINQARQYLLPVTGAASTSSILKWDFATNGGAFATGASLTSAGALTTAAGITAGGTVAATGALTATSVIRTAINQQIDWAASSSMGAPTNGLWNLTENSVTVGIQLNPGTTAPTFNNGTVTIGSRNTAGQMTLTGGNVGGTITFGAPNWTNTPFCVVTGSAATDTVHITAASVTAFTVAGMTANGVFTYICMGRI